MKSKKEINKFITFTHCRSEGCCHGYYHHFFSQKEPTRAEVINYILKRGFGVGEENWDDSKYDDYGSLEHYSTIDLKNEEYK